MTMMQILIVLCGLAAVVYGLVTSRQILSLDTGNDKMREIASAIQEGAREAAVSLSRQLKTLNEDQRPVVRPVIVRRHGKQEARVERNSHPKRRDGISEGTDATRKDRTFARVLRKRF